MKTLIWGGRVIDPANGIDRHCNLLLEQGKVAWIGSGFPDADETVDATGKITGDLSAALVTKNDLGDNYMMQSGSWKKQAGALAAYATGKTVAELKNGAIDETGKAPAGSDLASSASIYLGGYVSVIEKACKG
jgi:hypothetical protein